MMEVRVILGLRN